MNISKERKKRKIMKIKVEMEINNCYECPFKVRIYEHGYCATDCSKCGPYSAIPKVGFREDCPFLKK
jgi:hypothetical protein